MPLPRFRLRTLMIAVAMAGVALALGIAVRRHYFSSSVWRITATTARDSMTITIDASRPRDAELLKRVKAMQRVRPSSISIEHVPPSIFGPK